MSRIQALVYFFCLMFLVQPVFAGDAPIPPDIWTVRQAVSFALHNSPDVQMVEHRIRAAEAAAVVARSGKLPQVFLRGGYSRTNTPMYSFGNILNQGQFSREIDFNDPGTSDDLNLTASVQYRLYDGGRVEAGIDGAQASKKAVVFDSKSVYQQLGFEVVRSFYSIRLAQETLHARESALKAMDVSLSTARARYDAGDLLKVDLLSLEVQKSRAADDLIMAHHNQELARKGFLTLLGLESGSTRINASRDDLQEVPQNQGYLNRPELAGLKAMLKAAEARLESARGSYKPTVDLFGSYQVDQGLALDQGTGDSWMGGVKVEYVVYDGHRIAAEVSQAASKVAEIKAQIHKMKLGFNYEINKAYLALKKADERLQVTKKMVEQAVENARLSREQFKEGVVLSSDLIEVENRLTDARVHNLMAETARLIAIADLRRASGLGQFDDADVVTAKK